MISYYIVFNSIENVEAGLTIVTIKWLIRKPLRNMVKNIIRRDQRNKLFRERGHYFYNMS